MKGAKRLYLWMTEDQVKNTATRLDNKLEYNLSALMKVNISYTYATVAVYCKTGVWNVGCTDTVIASQKERWYFLNKKLIGASRLPKMKKRHPLSPKAPLKRSTMNYWLSKTLLIQNSKWNIRPFELCCCVVPKREYPNMEHTDQYYLQPLLNPWWLNLLSRNKNLNSLWNHPKALGLQTHLSKEEILYRKWKIIKELTLKKQLVNYLLVGGVDSCT